MVAAKLDQSKVLVTKFRHNRLTLKFRRAGQRQTDRHTHRQTERQTHRQTRLKIMALQVCNRGNRQTKLDGCIVWNAHNTVLGEEALLIYIVPVCYIKTGRYGVTCCMRVCSENRLCLG